MKPKFKIKDGEVIPLNIAGIRLMRPYKPELKVDNKPLINRYKKPEIAENCDLKTVREFEETPLKMLYKMGMVTDLQK